MLTVTTHCGKYIYRAGFLSLINISHSAVLSCGRLPCVLQASQWYPCSRPLDVSSTPPIKTIKKCLNISVPWGAKSAPRTTVMGKHSGVSSPRSESVKCPGALRCQYISPSHASAMFVRVSESSVRCIQPISSLAYRLWSLPSGSFQRASQTCTSSTPTTPSCSGSSCCIQS